VPYLQETNTGFDMGNNIKLSFKKHFKERCNFIVIVKGYILQTGDRQLHKPCHHLDQQMQAPVQSSEEAKRYLIFVFVSQDIHKNEK
jgi:hypothetical protein